MIPILKLHNFEPQTAAILDEVVEGLKQTPKYLSAKFNYDERGARLYEKLCQTKDYYLTRTELGIMYQNIQQIVAHLSEEILMIEYGSGNSKKTRLLFDHLPNLVGYIPIDISKKQLIETVTKIAQDYPDMEVLPVCADYTQSFELPTPSQKFTLRLIYYPGSTIGNIHPQEAILFLKQMRQYCQRGDALLIGVDLEKEPSILKQAYDDRDGITQQFNLINPLERLNREYGMDFVIPQYQHHIVYNEPNSSIEIYLKSLCDQTVQINGETIHFTAGELIERAVAYKYNLKLFQKLIEQAGWQTERVWTDDKQWFSIHCLIAAEQFWIDQR